MEALQDQPPSTVNWSRRSCSLLREPGRSRKVAEIGDQSAAGDRWRTLLRDCHFMFVYETGFAIGAERPEALAFIALEFFDRRDLFLVSRENAGFFPNLGFIAKRAASACKPRSPAEGD
jgi:hypothetical protein